MAAFGTSVSTSHGIPLPWAANQSERDGLLADADRVVGRSLSRVTYIYADASELDGPRQLAGFDEVDMAIELWMADGEVFSALWRMEGYNEGLSFGRGTAQARGLTILPSVIDVTASPRWQEICGLRILGTRLAWHVPNEDCPEAIWSVSLDFEGRAPITIALGVIDRDTRITYQPDGLVAIFDNRVARSYCIPASPTSALGLLPSA